MLHYQDHMNWMGKGPRDKAWDLFEILPNCEKECLCKSLGPSFFLFFLCHQSQTQIIEFLAALFLNYKAVFII